MAPTNKSFLELQRTVRAQLDKISGVVLVGVSGGADSMVLSAAALAESNGKRVIPVVVDHGLQVGSADIARKVVERLNRMGFNEVFSARADVQLTDGLEASARRARYKIFAQAIETYGAQIFLLAHTKNDQAESVLLGLARGSGTRSLAGMREQNGIYLRPFLDITKEEIDSAAKELNLEIWSDPHNENLEFKRVLIRKQSLPQLEKDLGPGIVDSLARSARIMGEDADALDLWADEVFQELGENNFEVAKLIELPKAVRARVLRKAIYAAGAPSGSVTSDHLRPVEALITAWNGQGECSLPGGVKVWRISGRITLSPRG